MPTSLTEPDSSGLEAFLGKEQVEEEVLSLGQARGLAATLDRDAASLKDGDTLPAGWHWIYFTPTAGRSALGPDGHEERAGFLPSPLPRRMWAGGSLRFPGRLRIGEQATRVSTIQSIQHKQGRSGPLVFVTVRHQISNQDGPAVEEEQNLVYLPETPPGEKAGEGKRPPVAAPAEADWSETYAADEITLFRFSALTFNSHRIHYDLGYVTEVEGYPGLVVHGPLLALLLLDAGIRYAGDGSTDLMPQLFRYRALRPLFCNEAFQLGGGSVDDVTKLWAAHPDRGVATEATLEVTD